MRATCIRILMCLVAMLVMSAGATMEDLAPVKVYIFGVQPSDTGITDAVADLEKAVAKKLQKTMRLVAMRAEADIAVEVLERDRKVMSRALEVRVHHRGGTATVSNYSTQGGFAYVAEGTMNWIDRWCQKYYQAVVGAAAANALRQMPPDLFIETERLAINDATIRANAMSSIGARGLRARAAAPALLELLDNNAIVTSNQVVTATGVQRTALTRQRVGVVAGRALVSIGAVEDLYLALASDRRERARENAAIVLGNVDDTKAVSALQAAAASDSALKVREAARQALQSRGTSSGSDRRR